jgi:hypothetical protein
VVGPPVTKSLGINEGLGLQSTARVHGLRRTLDGRFTDGLRRPFNLIGRASSWWSKSAEFLETRGTHGGEGNTHTEACMR